MKRRIACPVRGIHGVKQEPARAQPQARSRRQRRAEHARAALLTDLDVMAHSEVHALPGLARQMVEKRALHVQLEHSKEMQAMWHARRVM